MAFRIIFALAVVLQQYVLAIPRPGHGALAGYCNLDGDCHQGECCVPLNMPRGRRTLAPLDPLLQTLVSGHCVKLGTIGSSCLAQTSLQPPTGQHYKCPCASGYSCRGTGLREVPLGEIGSCTLTSRTLNQACRTGADCSANECCVTGMRPIGKKRSAQAHCKAMGTSGSSCLVKMGSGKPDHTVVSCPCEKGLTCNGRGVYDVPLGEMGTCAS